MKYVLVLATQPDETDPLWKEMQATQLEMSDSGLGSSLRLTSPEEAGMRPTGPQTRESNNVADKHLDLSKESGELSEVEDVPGEQVQLQEEEGEVQFIRAEPPTEGRMRSQVFKVWPDGHQLAPPPDSRATLITDRVGQFLTKVDRSMCMQNNVANTYLELAQKIDAGEINAKFDRVFVCIGIDWADRVKKDDLRHQLKRLLFSIRRQRTHAVVGILSLLPQFHDISHTKKQIVTFNRNLAGLVKENVKWNRVQFIPLHLHFVDQQGEPIMGWRRYFTDAGELTLAGGMVVREVLFKAIGLIPMDGHH